MAIGLTCRSEGDKIKLPSAASEFETRGAAVGLISEPAQAPIDAGAVQNGKCDGP